MLTNNEIKGMGIEEILTNIQNTVKEDRILHPWEMSVRNDNHTIITEIDGEQIQLNDTTLRQMNEALIPGFGSYAKSLAQRGMHDVYVDNINRLLPLLTKPKMGRIAYKDNNPKVMRAFLSNSYRRVDDDKVFGCLIDAIDQTPAAKDFMSLGGNRGDNHTYLKMITKEPAFTVRADGRDRDFSVGFILSNSEVGMGFAQVEVFLSDHYCSNGTIFSRQDVGRVRMLHRGRSFNSSVNGALLDALNGESSGVNFAGMRDAFGAAFNKDLYVAYKEAMQAAADIHIDDDAHAIEVFAKVIGKEVDLQKEEIEAIQERLLSTGDRSLFGVQAAITDSAKYCKDYERRVEMERAGGRIFTEVPKRWNIIKALAAQEMVA